MRRQNAEPNYCFTPLSSDNSSKNKYPFTFSEQLNSPYRPNFKKLSSKRSQYSSSSHINFRQLFSVKSLQKIITQQLSANKINCDLCECQYHPNEMFSLCNCEHKYCQNCLIELVNYKISTMEQIRCPEEFCNGKITQDGQIFVKLPEQLKKKYFRAQLWRQTISNPDLKLCPMQHCDGQVDMKLQPPICNACRKQYCSQCMMEKHLGNCDTIYETTHKQWRRCPSCRMFIAKTQGCNHIRCRCASQFCFVCLETWDNSHYNCMQKSQMLYFQVEQIKWPLLPTVLMVSLFPFLAILSLIGILVSFIFMIPVGFVIGMGLAFLKLHYLFCFVVIILPIGGALGAIVFPFYFTFANIIPFFIHHFRRYKITLQQLLQNLSRKQ